MQGFLDESGLLIFYLFIYFFAFYAEIQNGHQKWHENDFWEKSPVDSAHNLRVKNFVKIALSCSISEINTFLCFTQKFKMAAKSGGKTIFAKTHQYTLQIPCGSKISLKSLYLAPISKINRFRRLTQKFKMAAKSQIPSGSKISLKSLYLAPFPR